MGEGESALRYAEARWRRSVALPNVDEAFVRARLQPWPELIGRPWQLLGGGLRSLNVRIEDCVLRTALDAGGGALAKEAALLRRLAGELRVPRVLGSSAGALLLEFVEHVELPGSAEAGLRVGFAAGRLSRQPFAAAGFLDAQLAVAEPFASALDGLLEWAGPLAERRLVPRDRELAHRLRRLWERHEARLRELSPAVQLVHSDFKPANVKWLPEEAEVLILDWEFAWAGPPLFDLGMMLRWGCPAAFIHGVERGYAAAARPLPEDWQACAAVLDSFNLVGLLEHAGEDPLRDADVLGCLAQLVEASPASAGKSGG